MNNHTLNKIRIIQNELNVLEIKNDLLQAQRVIASVIKLLDDSVAIGDQSLFQLFTDSDGKIKANASWFYEDPVMTDRKATYKFHPENNLNLDIKLYGLIKPVKGRISWCQGLTVNFEDEPFNKNFNVGIDFIVPKSADRIIIVLSNNWVIRTLELKGHLTVTYQEILARWAEIKNFNNKTELHNILWESFDIQPLNKKFYTGISERFSLLRQYLVSEQIFDEKYASLFANRLIGRVIFCWFLDKKGIINPDQKYFDSQFFDNDNKYYKTKLERLFFGVLNTPIGNREFEDDVTPFLNGGLFEARKNDLHNDSKLSFPKNYFDDLFEFLAGYNFTTDESTSQFQQVAIDPEMLGRIFENLLAEMTEETGEQARKAKGAFYTPREIVDYMCKESLKEYLKTKIAKDEQLDQRLYQLIDAPDKDFQDQDHNWRRDWKPYKADILKALDGLKVLDPACGSGAFPIGMLQLLVRVYERLEARFDSYKTKLGIIEKNIYGVDIEPMAVEIARLRAWLSIIVDEESDSKKIKPLPNLEFKFICANSLIDLDKNGNNTFGDDPELQEKLGSIRDAYFNTESLNKKKKLRAEYEKLVTQGEGLFGESKKSKQLKTYRPFDNEAQADFFDPQFMFGVAHFNILIANPPYIKERGNKEKFEKVHKSELGEKWKNGKMDFWYYFLHRGISLISESGLITFITPSYWIQGDGSTKLIQHIQDELVFKEVVNIGKLKVFDDVAGHHMIATYQKTQDKISEFTYKKLIDSLESLNSNKSDNFITVENKSNKEVFKDGKILFDHNGNSNYSSSIALGDKYFVSQGVVEGTDKVAKKHLNLVNEDLGSGIFVLNKKELEDLNLSPEEKIFVKKYLDSSDIKRYTFSFKEKYLLYITKTNCDDIHNISNINEHLTRFKPITELRRETKKGSNKWFHIHWPRDPKLFDNKKIIFKGMFKTPEFTIDDQGYYFGMSMLSVTQQEEGYTLEFLLGILNSIFAESWFNQYGKKRGVGVDIGVNKLRSFPLPDLGNVEAKKVATQIENKVTEIQNVISNSEESQEKVEQIQNEINKLVNNIYKL